MKPSNRFIAGIDSEIEVPFVAIRTRNTVVITWRECSKERLPQEHSMFFSRKQCPSITLVCSPSCRAISFDPYRQLDFSRRCMITVWIFRTGFTLVPCCYCALPILPAIPSPLPSSSLPMKEKEIVERKLGVLGDHDNLPHVGVPFSLILQALFNGASQIVDVLVLGFNLKNSCCFNAIFT